METNEYKEVYFDIWCKTCRYHGKPETSNPCFDCLDTPTNLHSHKPVYWEENKK